MVFGCGVEKAKEHLLRIATWIGSSLLGYIAAGVIALVAGAYIASAFASSLTAREYVVAAQTLLWLLLAAGAVLLIGRALVGQLRQPPSWALFVGVLAPVFVSFALAADARSRSGALDIDQVGIAVFVPAALVAVAISYWASLLTLQGRRSWAVVTVFSAIATVLVGAIALLGASQQGPMTIVALVVAIGVGLLFAARSIRVVAT